MSRSMICNLLRGIDIWSSAAYKAQKSPFDNSFSNSFSLVQLLQTMLTIYGFHSENDFWKNKLLKYPELTAPPYIAINFNQNSPISIL